MQTDSPNESVTGRATPAPTMYDNSRIQVPILPPSRISLLASATSTTVTTPKVLASFEEIFRAALEQATRDYEMNRLFNSEFYE